MSSTATSTTAPPLSKGTQKALERDSDGLNEIHVRLAFVEAVVAALAETTRDRPFYIANESVYLAMFGEREMVAVELASWARGFYTKGGFLERLTPEDLDALGLVWNGAQPAPSPFTADLARFQASRRGEAFRYLFPNVQRAKPSANDRNALRNRLNQEFKPLHEDRDKYRAHKREYRQQMGTAKALDLVELREHLESGERLLTSLRYLLTDCSWQLIPESGGAERGDARDVVDLILCGTIEWMTHFGHLSPAVAGATYEEKRKAYYARLHAEHDARAQTDRAFNDPVWGFPKALREGRVADETAKEGA